MHGDECDLSEADCTMICKLARKLSRKDEDLADDLEQEAKLALMELGFNEIRLDTNWARYNHARTAMQNLLRREQRRKKIEKHFANGGVPPRQTRNSKADGATARMKRTKCSADGIKQLPVRRNAPRHVGAGPLD